MTSQRNEPSLRFDRHLRLLEFYPSCAGMRAARTPDTLTFGADTGPYLMRITSCVRALVAGVAVVVAGCAALPGTGVAPPSSPPIAAPLPRNAEPPPPSVNLSGFPLPYRQGYADGCASAAGVRHRDEARYDADPNYHTGWQDGVALCRHK